MPTYKFNLTVNLYATEVELEAESESDLDTKVDKLISAAEDALRGHWKDNEGLSMAELLDFSIEDVENLDKGEEEEEDDEFDFDDEDEDEDEEKE